MSMPSICREQVAGMNIHWMRYSLDAFLEQQERLGFRSIELWCAMPHVWLDHLTCPDAHALRKKIASRNLTVHTLTPENCTSPYQFAVREPAAIDRSYRYFSNGIRLAAELGCQYMEVNSGWGYWDEGREEAWKRSRDMLRRLAEFAESEGIVLTMESLRPEETKLVVTLEDAKRMIAEVDHPCLTPMVDTCAMSVSGETLDQWFEAFGSTIHEMHFVDGCPYGHLVWGDGKHHLGRWIQTLNRYHFEGYLGQEITDPRYYDRPDVADARNMRNFELYMKET